MFSLVRFNTLTTSNNLIQSSVVNQLISKNYYSEISKKKFRKRKGKLPFWIGKETELSPSTYRGHKQFFNELKPLPKVSAEQKRLEMMGGTINKQESVEELMEPSDLERASRANKRSASRAADLGWVDESGEAMEIIKAKKEERAAARLKALQEASL